MQETTFVRYFHLEINENLLEFLDLKIYWFKKLSLAQLQTNVNYYFNIMIFLCEDNYFFYKVLTYLSVT